MESVRTVNVSCEGARRKQAQRGRGGRRPAAAAGCAGGGIGATAKNRYFHNEKKP